MPNVIYAWDGLGTNESDPGPDIVPLTPSDSADISNTVHGHTVTGVRAIRVETGGDLKVTMASGQARTLKFADGETRVGQFVRLWSTGTTASGQIEGHI